MTNDSFPYPVGDCYMDGYEPFEYVTITRERYADGEPTERVEIEGLRDGGAREVRRLYDHLRRQKEAHLQAFHCKRLSDPLSIEELRHAPLRAAVALLMD